MTVPIINQLRDLATIFFWTDAKVNSSIRLGAESEGNVLFSYEKDRDRFIIEITIFNELEPGTMTLAPKTIIPTSDLGQAIDKMIKANTLMVMESSYLEHARDKRSTLIKTTNQYISEHFRT